MEASNERKRAALSKERESFVTSLNVLSQNSASHKENDRMAKKVVDNLKDNTLEASKVEDDIQAMIFSDCIFKTPLIQAVLMPPSTKGIAPGRSAKDEA